MTHAALQQILSKHKRVAIVGGTGSGKTTLAKRVTDRPVIHDADNIDLPWEIQPDKLIEQAGDQESFIIEGVHASRALRRGLKVDAIVHLTTPRTELSQKRKSFNKGQSKIIEEALAKHPHVPVYT